MSRSDVFPFACAQCLIVEGDRLLFSSRFGPPDHPSDLHVKRRPHPHLVAPLSVHSMLRPQSLIVYPRPPRPHRPPPSFALCFFSDFLLSLLLPHLPLVITFVIITLLILIIILSSHHSSLPFPPRMALDPRPHFQFSSGGFNGLTYVCVGCYCPTEPAAQSSARATSAELQRCLPGVRTKAGNSSAQQQAREIYKANHDWVSKTDLDLPI